MVQQYAVLRTLDDLRVVLVRPQEPRNVGQVCRAMKNMGLGSLYLVGAPELDQAQAAVTALSARDVLERAVRCAALPEALRGTVLSAGLSRRRGRWRKYFALDPEQLVERISGVRGPCALVFGAEADGLTDEELGCCHLAVRIPSSPRFPSLNLSHAVQILAYLLYRRLQPPSPERFRPVDDAELDSLVRTIVGTLEGLGFFAKASPEDMGRFWRDLLARAALERREAERLRRIFHEIRGLTAGVPAGVPDPAAAASRNSVPPVRRGRGLEA
jgi:TrmH family RNA methyltransferase